MYMEAFIFDISNFVNIKFPEVEIIKIISDNQNNFFGNIHYVYLSIST